MDDSGAAPDIRQRLTAAREKLDARDLAGALAIYEEVLPLGGQRADVLLTISGDLGSTGHIPQIIELIAPRYDASRHGPAIGFNLLQAYIAARDEEAAQHVLDILFALNRPDLEERLYGFSNAIADLSLQQTSASRAAEQWGGELPGDGAAPPPGETGGPAPAGFKIALVNITKPVWFYGLEPLAAQVLPPKEGRLRRAAFAQLALPDLRDITAAMKAPEDELGRLSRALPLWLSETFYFSPHYAPLATLGFVDQADGSRLPMVFWSEWTAENLRQVMDTTPEGVDYVFTGALRHRAGDYELTLRVFEMKKFRERKQFTARWTPATADAELAKLHQEVRHFMEWSPYPEGVGLAYTPPASPRAWLDALGVAIGLFLVEKKVFQPAALPPLEPLFGTLASLAAKEPAAALAWLTVGARARALGLAPENLPSPPLADHPLVAEAEKLLAGT